MSNPLPTIARAIPLLAGPALMLIPSGVEAQLTYARRFVFFILLLSFVGAVKVLLVRLSVGSGDQKGSAGTERIGSYLKRPLLYRGRELIDIIALIAAVFFMLGSMQAYRSASPEAAFPILVIAILAGAIESRLTALRSYPFVTALVAVVSGGAVSALSIFLSLEQWLWQIGCLALTFGILGGAASLATSIQGSTGTEQQSRRLLSRGLIIALVLPPITLGALVQLKELSIPYLLTFLVIPALSPVFRELKNFEETGAVPSRLRISVAAASLLFVVIVCGVSVLYRS